jgi:tetratricopeptide (TPR) repeat protein
MRTLLACILAAVTLSAQAIPLDEAFFAGERKLILREMAERLITAKRRDAPILAECGRAFLAGLEPTKARESLKAAEDRDPKDGRVLRLIALAWLKNGYKAEALTAYEWVLQRDPKNKEALTQCGVDLAEVGLMTEADKYMKALVAREPAGWESFLAFGRACLMGGHRKQAAFWFGKAIEVKPKEEKLFLEIMRAFAETQSVM